MKTLSNADKFDNEIELMIASGKRTLVISDYDHKRWNSGFVAYLMERFRYTNHAHSMTFFFKEIEAPSFLKKYAPLYQ